MSEKVSVRQNSAFEIQFWATDPQQPESDALQPVAHLHALTPYGMLLASLGACTTIVLHTYAQHHGVELEEVQIDLAYDRVFVEDCEHCTEIEKYEEQIEESIELVGELNPAERTKLARIAHQCSINKILTQGIQVRSRLIE